MIEQLLILVLFCFGAFAAIDTILKHFTGVGREDAFGVLSPVLQTILKPVFGCIYCSPTFWGNFAYFLLIYFNVWEFNAAEWLILYVSTCGVIWLTFKISRM